MNNDSNGSQNDLNNPDVSATSINNGGANTLPTEVISSSEGTDPIANEPHVAGLPDINSEETSSVSQPTLPPITPDVNTIGTPIGSDPTVGTMPEPTPPPIPGEDQLGGTPMSMTNGYSSAPTHIDPVIDGVTPPPSIDIPSSPDNSHQHSAKGKLKALVAAVIAIVLLIGIPLLALQLGVFRGDLRQRAAYEVTCGAGCVSGPNGEKKFCYNECIPGDTGYSRSVSCATGGYVRDGRNCDTACGATSCGGTGTGLTAQQVCTQRHGGSAGGSSTADPNCAANGGYSCDISGVNHCCYGDANSTSSDGDCYRGNSNQVTCSGGTITNNTSSSITIHHYTGTASDNSCPISNFTGDTTLAPGASVTAGGCEQIDAAGYCGQCRDSACSGGTTSSASSRTSSSGTSSSRSSSISSSSSSRSSSGTSSSSRSSSLSSSASSVSSSASSVSSSASSVSSSSSSRSSTVSSSASSATSSVVSSVARSSAANSSVASSAVASSQETLVCNKTCGNNSQCPTGTICSDGYCRNPECTSKTNCTCDGTAAACNSNCGDNTQCPAGTFCSNGKCRNTACPSDSDCTCTAVPPTGVAASGTMPDAGVSLPGLAVFGAGLIMAVLGILFAL